MLKFLYFFASVGILAGLVAAGLFVAGGNGSEAMSTFATAVSIILGVASIIYSLIANESSARANQETLKILDEIKEQNRRLVEKIHKELSKDNFNEQNIEYLRNSPFGGGM